MISHAFSRLVSPIPPRTRRPGSRRYRRREIHCGLYATPSTADIVIERKINENSDTTVNLTVKENGDGDLVLGTINTSTQEGVCDEVSVGWGTKIGLPYMLSDATMVLANLFNGADDNRHRDRRRG